MTLPYLVCAIITAISAAVSFGYSIAALRTAGGEAKTLALYAGGRSAALLLGAIAALVLQQAGWLFAIATMMIIVQAADAYIGTTIKDRLKTFGPALTALLNLAALIWAILS